MPMEVGPIVMREIFVSRTLTLTSASKAAGIAFGVLAGPALGASARSPFGVAAGADS
jgi:hypothetical protein